MLRDSDIDSMNTDLSKLSRANEEHHDNVQTLLKKFKDLLDDYSSLKSDYEEVKEGREKYKKQARGQDRNPFVLVLVDGDGYQFHERYIKAGSEGGINAARELNDSVRELMHATMGMQADQCRIMVRVYANILGLSKLLARAGLVGHEARALAPFTSAFNRAQDLFDFVDAAEKKEGSDFKIREMFRLFVDLNQCRHIYFAGCHDTGDRITLIKAASFHRDFEDLGLPIKELPAVFMSGPLVGTKSSPVHSINTKMAPAPPNGTKAICKHFQKGICKFGNSCNKQHIMPNQQLAKSTGEESPKPFWSTTPVVGRLKSEEFIPINKDGERLDTYCAHPSPDAFDAYHRRAKEAKVCNSYHLSGECGDMNCHYDHSDVSNTIIDVLRYICLQHPCPRGGSCRSIKCYMGHICQKPNCKAVKSWQCRFNLRAHSVDLQVAQWVAPIDQPEEDHRSSISAESFESNSPSTVFFS
ncbi:Zinc finger CCCH-type [Penicillium chermesinum]|nr:Zinc finger CCCH-type [Penicillium chermesinum]